MSLLGAPCPLCEGIGQLPASVHESALRSLADRLGFKLTAKPQAKPAAPTDWAPVIAALSAARIDLGFGAAVYTGSAKQLGYLRGHTVADWLTAIESQRASLDEALYRKRITRHQANTYLSLETISRNFDRCLQTATSEQPRHERLDDGRWVEVTSSGRRVLTDAEITALGLQRSPP